MVLEYTSESLYLALQGCLSPLLPEGWHERVGESLRSLRHPLNLPDMVPRGSNVYEFRNFVPNPDFLELFRSREVALMPTRTSFRVAADHIMLIVLITLLEPP